MRRDDDDLYRRVVRNGGPSFDRFNTDYLDQNCLSDFRSNEPKYEADHLASFAVGTKNGVVNAEDGLRKLRKMENTTGIWTMRCILIVDGNYLVIVDCSTGEELERFPIQWVQDPTAIFKNDRREIYNNLFLFTITDDPKMKSSQADMHIFQSSKAPAQEIVDEILAAKNGHQRLQHGNGYRIQPPAAGPIPEPSSKAYNFQGMREFIDSRHYQSNTTATEMQQFNQAGYSQDNQFGGPVNPQRSLVTRVNTIGEIGNVESSGTEVLERDVQLLNHCFDDIEKFVARLQQAAEAYKELEKRKRDRGAKNKKKQSGDGMLNARARPPPDRDFVDIFQKFKLSFNLLAKLKAHIHDPNAPELVHFLFTPLSLIYEASRDPYHGNQNLGDQAVAPVITADAKQLLLNCLTSKEIELWQALGKNWTVSRNEWQGPIPPYIPEFYDGWQPAAGLDELITRSAMISKPAIMAAPLLPIEQTRTQAVVETRQSGFNALQRPMPFPDDDRPMLDRFRQQDDFDRFESPSRGYRPSSRDFETRGFEPVLGSGFERNTSQNFEPSRFDTHSQERLTPNSGAGSLFSSDFLETRNEDRNVLQNLPKNIDREPMSSAEQSRRDENNAYLEELKQTPDAIIYEALHDRVGKNAKELTVQRGDILLVQDNSKNWWKLRNYKGEVGFAPYTILKAVKTEDDDQFGRREQVRELPSWATASETSFNGDDRRPTRREPLPKRDLQNMEQKKDQRGNSNSPVTRKRYVTPPRRDRSPPLQRNQSSLGRNESPQDDRQISAASRGSPTVARRRSSKPQKQAVLQRQASSKMRQSPTLQTQISPPPQRRVSVTTQTLPSPNKFTSGILQRRDSSAFFHGRGSSMREIWDSPIIQKERRSLSAHQRRDSDSNSYENVSHQRSPEESSYVNTSPAPERKLRTQVTKNHNPVKRVSTSFRNDPKPNVRTRSPSKQIPSPPPLPARPKVKAGLKLENSVNNVRQKNVETGKNIRDSLHEELQNKVKQQRSSFKIPKERSSKRHSREVIKIDQYSSAHDVLEWMKSKGFSDLAQDEYRDYTGSDMFQLHLADIEEVLGHEEAVRLDGLLTLQKQSSGYATRSAKELNEILRRRKENCERGIEDSPETA